MRIFRISYIILMYILSCTGSSIAKSHDNVYSKDYILSKMRSVTEWQINHPVHINDYQEQWARSVFYAGIMYSYNTTKDPYYLTKTIEWGNSWGWKRGPKYRHADDFACGQAYLDVYAIKHDTRMLDGIKGAVDTLMNNPKPGREDWWWCDALYMEPSVIARLGKLTGDKKYYSYLNEKYWDSVDYLYSKSDSLFYRDKGYFKARTTNGKKVFWGRGNAWVIGGLAHILNILPEETPMYKSYENLYLQMIHKIVQLQQPDGLWRASLLDPDEVPVKETSASTFFAYALIWGINKGLLPVQEYMPKVKKAWEALLGCINEEGKLGYVQPIGASPGSVKESDNQEYGSGAFLMVASELYKFYYKNK